MFIGIFFLTAGWSTLYIKIICTKNGNWLAQSEYHGTLEEGNII